MTTPLSGDAVLVAVEAHVVSALGQDSGRAGVTFLGTERFDVLRFGPDPADELVRYVTLGMSRTPMGDPSDVVVDPTGPRAELVLTVRGPHDTVLRSLAVIAAAPAVEGVVLAPGATLDLGQPLWEGSRASAVLLGEPGPELPDLLLDDLLAGAAPVRFLPVLPIHPTEAAWKRVHGAEALLALAAEQGLDLREPHRPTVRLPSL